MVDVSQDVIVREIDCGTTDGLWVSEIHEGKEKIESFRERLIGRFAVGDVVNPVTGKVIVPEGKMIDLYDANEIEAAGITKLKIRSLLTCRAKTGVCARCYGSDMANGEPVRLGESVGVIAAESIGEPGTQLTIVPSIPAVSHLLKISRRVFPVLKSCSRAAVPRAWPS